MLELEHPTIVRLLDRLETLGLIERHAMENDRRAKQVLLTEKALPYVHEVVEVSDQMSHALLDTIDDATGNFTKVAQRASRCGSPSKPIRPSSTTSRPAGRWSSPPATPSNRRLSGKVYRLGAIIEELLPHTRAAGCASRTISLV